MIFYWVKKFLLIPFVITILGGCSNGDEMVGRGIEVTLDLDKYLLVQNPRAVLDFVANKQFMVVVYFGSEECNVCSLKQTCIWDMFADRMGREHVNYIFIMDKEEDVSVEVIRAVLSRFFFSFPIYLDCGDYFRNDNPQIELSKGVMCLLLDSNNRILECGNPEKKRKDFERFVMRIKNME